jgi:hypothetical protein
MVPMTTPIDQLRAAVAEAARGRVAARESPSPDPVKAIENAATTATPAQGGPVKRRHGPASGIAAHGKYEPFELRNTAHLRHGVRSRSGRFVDPLAGEISAALLAERPDLAAWPEALAAWARAEARCLLYAEYHARVGTIDPETGDFRGGARVLAAERLAGQLRERLGLDPVAEAQLAKTRIEAAHTVVDLEAIRARGRSVLERRRAELTVVRDAEAIDVETVETVEELDTGGA